MGTGQCEHTVWGRTFRCGHTVFCAVEMHMDMSQELSYARTDREHAAPQMDPETATYTLCEPAQSRWTWTCHKSPADAKKLEEKLGNQMEHPDQTQALPLTVKARPRWTHGLGNEPVFMLSLHMQGVSEYGRSQPSFSPSCFVPLLSGKPSILAIIPRIRSRRISAGFIGA